MGREIKFRVWDKVSEEMLYPEWEENYVGGGNKKIGLFIYKSKKEPPSHSSLSWILKHPEYFVLEQFTGLKDKNGKGDEVYANNIVSSFNGVNYLVYWDDEYGQWWARIINKTKGKYTRPLCDILDNSYMHIIGNVHEHPDLMENGK